MDGEVDQIEDTSIESRGHILAGTLGVPADPLDVTLEEPRAKLPIRIQHLESPGLAPGEASLHPGQGRGTGWGGGRGGELQVGQRRKILQVVEVGNISLSQCVCCSS